MKLTQSLGLSAGLIIASTVFPSPAQTPEPGGPSRPSALRTPPGGPGRAMDGFGPVRNILTAEQRRSVFQAMQAQRDELRALEPRLREARRELLAAALGGTFDEAAVRKQAGVIAGLEAQITVLRAKALSQVQPALSPEQIEEIKNAQPAAGAQRMRPPRAQNPGNRGAVQDTNRDVNDLPPKQ